MDAAGTAAASTGPLTTRCARVVGGTGCERAMGAPTSRTPRWPDHAQGQKLFALRRRRRRGLQAVPGQRGRRARAHEHRGRVRHGERVLRGGHGRAVQLEQVKHGPHFLFVRARPRRAPCCCSARCICTDHMNTQMHVHSMCVGGVHIVSEGYLNKIFAPEIARVINCAGARARPAVAPLDP